MARLQEEGAWSSDLWKGLLRGWQNSVLKEEQWKEILTFLKAHAELYVFAYEISELLKEGITKPQTGFPSSCLSLAEDIAERLWTVCDEETADEELPDDSWFGSIMVVAAANIVEFWLYSLSRRQAEAGESWNDISKGYKDLFQRILDSESAASQTGSAILAGRLRFLFALDANWARERILPLLDWSIHPRRAQRAWQGFLTWGQCNEALLLDLLPLYEETFPHIRSKSAEFRKGFSKHLASIAVYSSSNSVAEAWLREFLKAVDAEDRKTWASIVGRHLTFLKEDAIRNVWDSWMSAYWDERITGVPVPLDEGELEEMVQWLAYLGPAFPAAVDKIRRSSPPSLEHPGLFYEALIENRYATRYPKALAKLLNHLLLEAHKPFWHCGEIEALFRDLAECSMEHDELEQICQELARLDCPNAENLSKILNS